MSARIRLTMALLVIAAFCISSVNAGEVREKAIMKVVPFSISDVRLLDGPFKHAEELNEKYLLSLDPDRLLV